MDIFKEDREVCWSCHEKEISVECDYCGGWICEACAVRGKDWFFGHVPYCKSCFDKRVVELQMWPKGSGDGI